MPRRLYDSRERATRDGDAPQPLRQLTVCAHVWQLVVVTPLNKVKRQHGEPQLHAAEVAETEGKQWTERELVMLWTVEGWQLVEPSCCVAYRVRKQSCSAQPDGADGRQEPLIVEYIIAFDKRCEQRLEHALKRLEDDGSSNAIGT